MGKSLRKIAGIALEVAAVALMFVPGVNVALGVSMVALRAISLGVGLAGSLLSSTAMTAPATALQQGGQSPVTFTPDPFAGIPYVAGRTGFAGRIINVANSGDVPASGSNPEIPNNKLHYFTVLSAGPIQAIDGFLVTKVDVNFDSDGSSTTAPYNGYMWQRRQLGTLPAAAMIQPPGSLNNSGAYSGWDSTHKLTQLAATWWTLAADNPPYANGVPDPLWVIRGVMVYDPRLDSTQTAVGGSGSQRINDETTWTYSENPHLHALTWAIGRKMNGKRVLGVGAPATSLDIAAYVHAANVADANGWKAGGVAYSTDSKLDVLKAYHEAGGGSPMQLRASLSCTVSCPRVSIATVTADDLAGAPQIAKTAGRRDRINQVIPTYRSEDHDWQQVAADPIVVAAYVTADRGELRSTEVTYAMVQNPAGQAPNQAAQLARYQIENSREMGPIVLPLRPSWMGVRPGDCITVNDAQLSLVNQKVVVQQRQFDPSTGTVTLTCTGETDAKHAAALAQVGVAPPVEPSE